MNNLYPKGHEKVTRKSVMFLIAGIFLLSLMNFAVAVDMCEVPVDVSHVLDYSDSMKDVFDDVKISSKMFIDLFDSNFSLMGLRYFDKRVYLGVALTNDFNVVKLAIDSLGFFPHVSSDGTNLHEGLLEAHTDFLNLQSSDSSRDFVQDYIIVVSDGDINYYIDDVGSLVLCYPPWDPFPNDCSNYTIATAQDIKDEGIKIYVIGLQGTVLIDPVREQILKDISSGPDYYYPAPLASDLEGIYEQIALEICVEDDANLDISDDSDDEDVYVDEDITFYADLY